MIIVKLKGGMGNQMFQYAVGRWLALKHNSMLKLDLSYLMSEQTDTTPRNYELGHFRIAGNIMSTNSVTGTSSPPDNEMENFNLQRKKEVSRNWLVVYREKHYHFDPCVLKMPGNCYMDGFWQSEKYFCSIKDLILKEFTVSAPLLGKNHALAAEIKSVNSVSVHIRRGDYVNDKKTNAIHGICDLDYYSKAGHLIEQKVKSPRFFIFSDDPEWVGKNLSFSHPATLVSHNREKAHEDMRLMSFCKHHVIANSSFSWWGAWLGRQPGKIVIAPKRWFFDPSINTHDLIPSRWVRI